MALVRLGTSARVVATCACARVHVQLGRETGLHAVAREGQGLFLCLDIDLGDR